jgi:hypothetical protein
LSQAAGARAGEIGDVRCKEKGASQRSLMEAFQPRLFTGPMSGSGRLLPLAALPPLRVCRTVASGHHRTFEPPSLAADCKIC